MKTLLRRLGLSLLAMSGGWIACNLAWWLPQIATGNWIALSAEHILFIGIYTGAVILAAWLIIFLPVDFLVPPDSRLRRPGPAALCGFLAVFIPVILCYFWVTIEATRSHGWLEAVRRALAGKDLPQELSPPFVLFACITGTSAAWLRSLLSPSNPVAELKYWKTTLFSVLIYNTTCLILLTSAGPFVDQKQTREYWMTWEIKPDSDNGMKETEVVLSFVDFPGYCIGEYSNALAAHLRQKKDRTVKVAFEITSDFGKIKSHHVKEIDGLMQWSSEWGYSGYTDVDVSPQISPWE